VFEAFVGFRPLEEIAQFLIDYPEFKAVTSSYQEFITVVKSTNGDKKQSLKKLFSALQHQKPEIIKDQVSKLITRIEKSKKVLDILLCRLNSQYPNDVGIFCALLLNYVVLQPDEAIFLAANEPHAYISGDCIECMAASDNVVRSGLTPKFKDVDTLVEMLTYNYGSADSQILRGCGYEGLAYTREYNPPIEEFSILQTKLMGKTENIKGVNGPGIMIVTEGSGKFEADGKSVDLGTGSIYFIPAMEDVTLTGVGTDAFVVYRAFCTV
jgi:mannose-6-phosphate isomerase